MIKIIDGDLLNSGADWNEVYSMINETFKDCDVELWRMDRG